ncbi:MAG: hypothetical protein WAN35_01265 [Terracidiphilus sp.]
MCIRNVLLASAVLSTAASISAQPHTWVSMTGNDNNPCTYASPCASFQGALAKTAANGTISVEGPGDYSSNLPTPIINISQSVTIDGMGVTSMGGNTTGYIFMIGNPYAPATPLNVTIRGLTLNGMGQTEAGINAAFTGSLTIDNCLIENFTQEAVMNNGTNLVIKNSTLLNSTIGLNNQSGNASLQNVTIQGSTSYGVYDYTGIVEINNSVLTQNLVGVGTGAWSGLSTVENSMLTLNGTAVCAVARLFNNDILDNTTGIANCDGIVQTNGNNRISGNTSGTPIVSSNVSEVTLF